MELVNSLTRSSNYLLTIHTWSETCDQSTFK